MRIPFGTRPHCNGGKKVKIARVAGVVALLVLTTMANAQNETNWPQATSESRPWARWWWMGSAVDKATLTTLLEQYRAAGFGGVEICPIYGAQGAEAKFIDYLSPQWMEMLAHTTDEGRRLDFGVDFTTGTGWPYGGPQVTPEAASNKAVFKTF